MEGIDHNYEKHSIVPATEQTSTSFKPESWGSSPKKRHSQSKLKGTSCCFVLATHTSHCLLSRYFELLSGKQYDNNNNSLPLLISSTWIFDGKRILMYTNRRISTLGSAINTMYFVYFGSFHSFCKENVLCTKQLYEISDRQQGVLFHEPF